MCCLFEVFPSFTPHSCSPTIVKYRTYIVWLYIKKTWVPATNCFYLFVTFFYDSWLFEVFQLLTPQIPLPTIVKSFQDILFDHRNDIEHILCGYISRNHEFRRRIFLIFLSTGKWGKQGLVHLSRTTRIFSNTYLHTTDHHYMHANISREY